MERPNKKLIAVVGATGQQGGAVVRALQANKQFKVRALTRNPAKHSELGDEVVQADLTSPETLTAAFEGAHGVFLVTNLWEVGTDEVEQATAAVRAAKDAGVKHFVWSTLPDVEAISSGKFYVLHLTGKAKIDRIVEEARFAHHTFVVAPMYYQSLVGVLAPQKQADGWGRALPLDPEMRCIHMGDISELGAVVSGASTYLSREEACQTAAFQHPVRSRMITSGLRPSLGGQPRSVFRLESLVRSPDCRAAVVCFRQGCVDVATG
jgi:hypothetical protein